MDDRGAPLTMTKTLGPSIAFVAETAAELIRDGEEQKNFMREGKGKGDSEAVKDTRRKRDTVRWVLATPERLGGLLEDGKRGEAVEDWKEVKELLDRWEGVKGVAELREACEKVMGTISEKEEPS